MKRMSIVLVLGVFLGLVQCTKPTAEQLKMRKLEQKVSTLEEEYDDISKRIKKASDDGTKQMLQSKQASLKSRIERMRATLGITRSKKASTTHH